MNALQDHERQILIGFPCQLVRQGVAVVGDGELEEARQHEGSKQEVHRPVAPDRRAEDEAGQDGKVLAVPTDKILSIYTQWQKPEDLNPMRLKTIAHFFEHYKDLEEGKWVKVLGWEGIDAAKKEILDGIANYAK